VQAQHRLLILRLGGNRAHSSAAAQQSRLLWHLLRRSHTCRFAPKHSDAFYHIACAFLATLCAHRYVAFENLTFSAGTKRRTYSYFAGLIETGEMRSAAMVHASEQSQETKTENFQI
jgi:hypothetical protein